MKTVNNSQILKHVAQLPWSKFWGVKMKNNGLSTLKLVVIWRYKPNGKRLVRMRKGVGP